LANLNLAKTSPAVSPLREWAKSVGGCAGGLTGIQQGAGKRQQDHIPVGKFYTFGAIVEIRGKTVGILYSFDY
jgi:hypothetical protein